MPTPHTDHRNDRRRGLKAFALASTALGLGLLVLVVPTARATQGDPEHEVTLCHATDSDENPYVENTVDVASVHFAGHDGHDGPIWVADHPKHEKWGDIIPAFDIAGIVYLGQNVPAGAAFLANHCNLPLPTTTTTAASTTTSTTEASTTTSTTEASTTTSTTEASTTTSTTAAPTTTSTTEASTTTSTTEASTTTEGPTTTEAVTTTEDPTTTVALNPTIVLGEELFAPDTSLPKTGADMGMGLVGGVLLAGGLAMLAYLRRTAART